MTVQRFLLAALFVAIGLAGGYLLLSRASRGPAAVPESATILATPLPLPDFTLTDEHGAAFTRTSLEGGWHLLFFGFTHCPDICPVTLKTLSVARDRLAGNGVDPLPGIVFVSVDPERDTPAVLAEYSGHFGAGVTGVTGPAGELAVLTSALGIHFTTSPTDDGGYTVDHSAAVLGVDPDGRLAAVFSAPQAVDALVHDVPIMMDRE